jgi:alpha-tubulin suppressor-like RCC1 family protein
MNTARPSLRPALLAVAAVILCLAGVTAGAPRARAQAPQARAQGVLPTVNRHAALSWGCGGLLGNGTATDSSLPGAVTGLSTGVVQVAAGYDHAPALTSNGTVWAWGDNYYGELGNGTTTFAWSPARSPG